MIQLARVYFVRGDYPGQASSRYEIKDPPCAGMGHVVVIAGEKRSTLLSPFSLETWQVSNSCNELRGAQYLDCPPETIAKYINKAWKEAVKFNFQRDFSVAAMVLTSLGQPVPKYAPTPTALAKIEHPSKRGGKALNERVLRPCRKDSKRGQIAAFFLSQEPQSLHEAAAKLGLTRSGVLSHLFMLNKEHGVGYALANDCAQIIVPEGFDLFAWVEPEKRQLEKPAKVTADGLPVEPKKRTGGKAIIPEALKAIPEPSKRAGVARFFVPGFHDVSEVCAALSLDRSAVLSHLFTINKENGLGYELSEDGKSARLLIPEGHIVFEPKTTKLKK